VAAAGHRAIREGGEPAAPAEGEGTGGGEARVLREREARGRRRPGWSGLGWDLGTGDGNCVYVGEEASRGKGRREREGMMRGRREMG
jgi:hypothetical protein